MNQVVTPAQVENRLVVLSKELDVAHDDCVAAELGYVDAKSAYEIGIAKSRMHIGQKHAERGYKATVQEREDEALLATSDLLEGLYRSEAIVKAARSNVQRIRTQVDIARSVSASVRTSLEV